MTARHPAPRLLMIALDAADPVLIERWTGDGTLPHLDALRRQGVSGRLTSGNHRGEGFIVARGPGLSPGSRLSSDPDIVDLAPTVVQLLGTHARVPLAGRVVPELVPAS